MPHTPETRKRAYDKILKRKTDWFRGKSCEVCGSTERLENDHRDPSTKDGHCIWSWKEERLRAELAKCNIKCRACHIERHRKERIKPLVHGTINAYDSKKCRCKLCVAEAARLRSLRRFRAWGTTSSKPPKGWKKTAVPN